MYNQLTREQRYGIYLGISEGKTQKAIALQLGVHPSTIGREIKRNSNRFGHYGWTVAHDCALSRRERFPGNKKLNADLIREARGLLVTEDWSPRQISGYLGLQGKHISRETIYRLIREDDSGELASHCRHKMKYRHHQKRPRPTKVRSIPNRISIHDRPVEADGKRFGDWEMDLIVGKKQKGAILTLCERCTNFMIMSKLKEGKKPLPLAQVVINLLLPYKKYVKTITTDNGSEFSCHQKIAKALETTVYFADSYASWQKGAIENTNKLIRQYIPKGSDFKDIDEVFIRNIQFKINRRPREKLKFSTPKKEFFKNVS